MPNPLLGPILRWFGKLSYPRLFLVAAVDLTGNDREEDVARRLRRLDHELEQDEVIGRAVLTLALPEDPAIAG